MLSRGESPTVAVSTTHTSCPHCGYDVSGLIRHGAALCPECGVASHADDLRPAGQQVWRRAFAAVGLLASGLVPSIILGPLFLLSLLLLWDSPVLLVTLLLLTAALFIFVTGWSRRLLRLVGFQAAGSGYGWHVLGIAILCLAGNVLAILMLVIVLGVAGIIR